MEAAAGVALAVQKTETGGVETVMGTAEHALVPPEERAVVVGLAHEQEHTRRGRRAVAEFVGQRARGVETRRRVHGQEVCGYRDGIRLLGLTGRHHQHRAEGQQRGFHIETVRPWAVSFTDPVFTFQPNLPLPFGALRPPKSSHRPRVTAHTKRRTAGCCRLRRPDRSRTRHWRP